MSATATMPITKAQEPAVPVRTIVAFIFMVFGMFMAILDIQIVSSSLAEIQAGISASADEITWVQTSYLIAEVVMIPLSGTLTRIFSTRWLFVASAASFTVMSLMCALSSSINEMMVWRALQGFLGGAMIPTVFATSFTVFPPRMRTVISPVIGLIATLAPTIGPTVGGYLTELFSWHWLFLVNIIPGIAVTIGAYLFIDFDKPNYSLIKFFDWTGLALLAVFLGTLEYVLEEGPGDDWLNSAVIRNLVLLCATSGGLFFYRMFTKKDPLVDFSAFKDRNFASGCLFSFTMGIGLYGLTYLYPVYLARIQNYSSMMIGETMFVTGVAMFLTAPIAGRLSAKVDPRIMIGGGFVGFAIGTWQAHYITSDWAFHELLIPQILRGVSLMMCMVTVTNISLGTLSPQMLRGASGLFNLTRNLGGAVGLALINTTMNNRFDLHLQRLHETVSWSSVQAQTTLNNMTHAFSRLGSNADLAALKQMSLLVRRQAFTLAIADIFFVLTILFLGIVLMLPLLKKPTPPPASAGGGH
ncbi:DHA2 family efflux MFS transporter permease subunit [Aestuariivirga litoralis]|uniref:DHA2 family efflux MFS transporter permease subunit n=1 Tax=Aestuariivirga litoralis TaxID=2650924 RepID=UPI0018C4FB11|nr:DHA2 family efflux MFS transporter permease subunit [Aestuariivirga litoralis]MBG1233137.1 DHA2 family efflux MFS transporter permease subunit [Aestuariivirga litoralis]